MCQDPEIPFVLVMLAFKRKQFAYDLRSGQLLTVFLLPSSSLYFLVSDAVISFFFSLLNAWNFSLEKYIVIQK